MDMALKICHKQMELRFLHLHLTATSLKKLHLLCDATFPNM